MEDRLYKFARLVDAGSYTKAAKVLHISQPALSAAIKKLERELRSELLVRTSRTFRLTPAGQAAYETAKQLHTQAANLRLRLAEASIQNVQLNIGMIDSVADLLFVHGNELHNLEQGAHVSLVVDNTAQLERYVEHDDLDVALAAKQTHLPQALVQNELGQEPLLLVTHTSQARQIRRSLLQKELPNFLGYNQNSHTYQLVERHFAAAGIAISPTFYSTSPEIMLQLVLAGRGAAALPYLLVKQYVEQGSLVAIAAGPDKIILRTIVSLHRKGRTLPVQAQHLLEATRTALNTQTQHAKTLTS